jgi:hypothetical protein
MNHNYLLDFLLFGPITENLLIVENQILSLKIFIFAARGRPHHPHPLPSNTTVLRYDALSFYKLLLHHRNLEAHRNLRRQNCGPEPHQKLDFRTNRLIQLDDVN